MRMNLSRKRYVHVANAARDARRWSEARLNYEAALAEDPSLDGIWVQLGHARKESGDLQAAETAYREALSLRPDMPDTHLQLGHLFKIMGRLDDSAKAYAQAVRLQPGGGDASDELKRMGFTPEGVRVFAARFSAPMAAHSAQGSLWFTLHVTLTEITAPEVLRLHARHGLQLGCSLHSGVSTAPADQTGTARFDPIDETTLRCRFVLSHDSKGRSLHLAKVGFFYEDAGSFAAWNHADTWMVLDMRGGALGQLYSRLTAGR